MGRRRLMVVLLGGVLALAGCGSDAPDAGSGPSASPSAPVSGDQTGNPCLGEGGPAEAPNSGPDTDVYLGLTAKQARRLAADNSFTLRIAGRDGECYPMTMDYRTDRVNVYLEDGVVTAATIG